MPALILLVNRDKKGLREIEVLLSADGYLIAATSSLRRASTLLNSVIPDLLVANILLGDFVGLQGLQLAVLSRRDHPNLPVIITHTSHDPELENRAKSLGMPFIVNPLENPEFRERVKAAVGERRPDHMMIRQWPRKRVIAVEARVEAAPAQLVDVSYEGLRLELQDPGISPATVFDVALPTAGVTIKTERVWRGHAPEMKEFWWGMKLVDTDPSIADRWRQFVDSIAESDFAR